MNSPFRFFVCAGFSGLALLACGEPGPSPSGSGGSGNAASGGSSASGGSGLGGSLTGGATASGGAASGGQAASGGSATSGGQSTSGGSTSGGTNSGGASGGNENTGGGATGGNGSGGGTGGGTGAFALHSPDWDVIDNDECTKDTGPMCPLYPEESTNLPTTGPKNISPEMSWNGVPAGTQSFAIVLHDLSNGASGFTHWVLWDIPADVDSLMRDLPKTATLTDPAGAQQISVQGGGYFGSGKCGNVYEHRVYALKVPKLNPPMMNNPGAVRSAILALGDDILGESFARMQSRDYCTIKP